MSLDIKRSDVMAKLFAGLLLSLVSWAALAQTTEAPTPQASPVTVVIFLVLFIGGCIAYVAYTWWRGRSEKETGED